MKAVIAALNERVTKKKGKRGLEGGGKTRANSRGVIDGLNSIFPERDGGKGGDMGGGG